jgi:ABC-type antimicrobial peptide transport system permease subunit
MRQVDSKISPQDGMTIRELIDNNLWIARCIGGLLAALGCLGLLLASVGLYGVTAYSVGQRRREIGLQLALGAARISVMMSVIRRGMRPIIYGVLAGSAIGLTAAMVIRSLLPNVVSLGLPGFLAVAFLMTAVGAAACVIPARRASAVDPAVALRAE